MIQLVLTAILCALIYVFYRLTSLERELHLLLDTADLGTVPPPESDVLLPPDMPTFDNTPSCHGVFCIPNAPKDLAVQQDLVDAPETCTLPVDETSVDDDEASEADEEDEESPPKPPSPTRPPPSPPKPPPLQAAASVTPPSKQPAAEKADKTRRRKPKEGA